MKVAIVGCGLSGLCLAQSLKQKGIRFQLFERDHDKETRRQGYRITVDERGLKALETCLPNELFQLTLLTAGMPGGCFRFLRADKREIFKVDVKPKPGESDKYAGRQMDRAVLREILFAGLEDYIAFGKSCIKVTEEANRVVLRFADGTSHEADLVIAADGSSSALRSAAGQAEPASLNSLAIYGKTPFKPELIPAGLERSGVLAIGPPGTAFFFTAIQFKNLPQDTFPLYGLDGSRVTRQPYIMWAVALSQPNRQIASLTDTALLGATKGLMEQFHPDFQRMVIEADPPQTLAFPLRASKSPSEPVSKRVLLMGDAAHLMPPFGAHGGNTALKDAAQLAQCFGRDSKFEEIEPKLKQYQIDALAFGFKQVRSAKRQMWFGLSRNPLLRFTLLRLMPLFHRV